MKTCGIYKLKKTKDSIFLGLAAKDLLHGIQNYDLKFFLSRFIITYDKITAI